MEIKLYKREGCPKCQVLEKKLQATGLPFEIIDDAKEVVKIGRENKIMSAPILVVDDKVMGFSDAVAYVSNPEDK